MAVYPDKKAGKPTGRWCVEVQKRGQRLRDRCDTFAEAKAREAEFTAQLDSGIVPMKAKRKFSADSSRPTTLSEAVKRAEGHLWVGKASEIKQFRNLRNIVTLMGDRELDAIDATFLDDLVATMRSNGRTDATVNRYFSALHKLLEWCLRRGYRTQPIPEFAWLDEDEGRIRWITDDEELELLALLPENIAKLVRIAIRTGMRRGELLSVEPDQITPGWVHLWETKSGYPRSIPLSPEDEVDLRYLAAGAMPTNAALRHHWDKAKATMGLEDDPWFVFHACRHTCATRMVMANVNIRVIKEYMGHRSIQTTLRYTHINNSMLSDALNALLGRDVASPLREVA
jgi:integrase